MQFDRWAICAAYNMYSVLYGHDAYTNGIQARLSRLRYRPPSSDQFLETLEPEAKEIFAKLVRSRESRSVAVDRFIRRADGRVPGMGRPFALIARDYPAAVSLYEGTIAP